MMYSYNDGRGSAMRAFALLLASALIVALVWFVSYKNGCVTCSGTDSPSFNTRTTDPDNDPATSDGDKPAKPSLFSSCKGNDGGGETSGTEPTKSEDQPEDQPGGDPQQTDNKKVSFEVVIDGRSTRFEIDLDNLEDHKINVTSEDGVTAVFEKGSMTDIKVTVDTPTIEPIRQPASNPPQPSFEDPKQEDTTTGSDVTVPDEDGSDNSEVTDVSRNSDVQGNSDIASAEPEPAPAAPAKEPAEEPQPVATLFNADLPAVTLLDGADFGMEGRVLALGKGSERRDGIVAVIPNEGKTVALLCETRTTKKTIDAVKDKYPGKIIYTYTIDREFFVNLRGNSKFELHNLGKEIDIQSGISKPDWLNYSVNTISDDQLSAYIAKNDMERYHVKGTKGCLVICESNDVFRYNWDKYGNYN